MSDTFQDIDARLTMALQDGVTAASEQSVLVLISIEAVESSRRIRQDLTVTGLGAGLVADLSPNSVDVIMSGPLPVLDSMTAENVKVIVDLLHLKPGGHEIKPFVVITGPDVAKTEQVLPEFIRVNILSPTNTPVPTATQTTSPKTPTMLPEETTSSPETTAIPETSEATGSPTTAQPTSTP